MVIQDTWPSPSFIQLFFFLTIILVRRLSVLERFHCIATHFRTQLYNAHWCPAKSIFASSKEKEEAKESSRNPICTMNKSLEGLYIVRIRWYWTPVFYLTLSSYCFSNSGQWRPSKRLLCSKQVKLDHLARFLDYEDYVYLYLIANGNASYTIVGTCDMYWIWSFVDSKLSTKLSYNEVVLSKSLLMFHIKYDPFVPNNLKPVQVDLL